MKKKKNTPVGRGEYEELDEKGKTWGRCLLQPSRDHSVMSGDAIQK